MTLCFLLFRFFGIPGFLPCQVIFLFLFVGFFVRIFLALFQTGFCFRLFIIQDDVFNDDVFLRIFRSFFFAGSFSVLSVFGCF